MNFWNQHNCRWVLQQIELSNTHSAHAVVAETHSQHSEHNINITRLHTRLFSKIPFLSFYSKEKKNRCIHLPLIILNVSGLFTFKILSTKVPQTNRKSILSGVKTQPRCVAEASARLQGNGIIQVHSPIK